MEWLRQNKGRLIFLLFLVLLTYFNSLNNEFVSDDVFGIVNNESLGDFGEVLSRPFYSLRPLVYWLVFSLFGKQAMYFRLVNLVFHVLVVWGIYALVGLVSSQIASRLLRRRGSLENRGFADYSRLSLVAAMLFAVHPLGVEAVAWISGGSYVQMTAFGIWSLVFYVLATSLVAQHSGRVDKRHSPESRFVQVRNRLSLRYYFWSLLFLVLALCTMERAMVVVGLMGVLMFLLGKLGSRWRYLIVPVGLTLVWLWISLRGVGVRQENLQANFYNRSVEANFWLQAPVAIVEYLKLFVWPVGLTLYHSDLVFNAWQIGWRMVASLVFLAGTVWSFFKNRAVFFWLSWFLVCLSPTLLPLGVSWIVAERYVYMAMIGLAVLTAMGFEWVLGRVRDDGRDVVNFVLVLLVGGLMFRSILRNNDWQTADDLWFSAERYSTLSPQNHNNLGDAYGKRGMLELSRDHFLRAIELNPGYADAMHNLGNTYLQMGEIDKAKESFERAVENNPKLWQSRQALEAIEKFLSEGGGRGEM